MIATMLGFLWRRHRLTLALALLVPVVLGVTTGLLAPQIRQHQRLLESLPIVAGFLGSEYTSALSPISLFCAPYQDPLASIVFAVFPAVPAIALLAGERGSGGLELLLATPLERGRLIATAGLFALLTTAMLPVACFAGTVCGAAVADDLAVLPLARFWLAGANAWGVALFWAGAGLVMAAVARTRGSATLALAVAVTLALTLDSMSRLAPQARLAARFTPFGYLRPADVVGGSPAWLPHFLGLAGAGALLALLAGVVESNRRRA